MSKFAALRAELIAEVFDQFADTATRTGYPLSFAVRIARATASDEGVSYEATTARIYKADAELANGEQITIGSKSWEIDGVIERDELTITYTLRAI